VWIASFAGMIEGIRTFGPEQVVYWRHAARGLPSVLLSSSSDAVGMHTYVLFLRNGFILREEVLSINNKK